MRRRERREAERGFTLMQTAEEASREGRLEEAERAYRESLGMFRPLADARPEPYERVKAAILSNLGRVLWESRRLQAAETALQETVEIYGRLVLAQPETYKQLAGALNNLGTVRREIPRLEESAEAYRDALEIYRMLAEQLPEVYEPNVANTLGNLGDVLHDLRHWDLEEKAYREGAEICRRLAQADPEVYEPLTAASLNNLGSVLCELGRLEDAGAAYEEALEGYRRLARAQPEMYESDVAMASYNLGGVLQDLIRLEEAEAMYKEALEIARRLARMEPVSREPELARILNNLGNTLVKLGRLEEAEETLGQAVRIRRRLAVMEPSIHESNLAMSLNNLSDVLHRMGRWAEAEETCREGLSICRRVAKAEPKKYEERLAAALNQLGDLLRDLRRLEEAEQPLREAVEIGRRLTLRQPEAYEAGAAMMLNNLGNTLRELGRLQEAEKAYREVLEVFRRQAQARPEVHEPLLAGVLNNLGIVLRLRRKEDAREAFKESVDIRRRLAATRPEIYEPVLAKSLNNLGNFLNEQSRPEEAEQALQESVKLYQRLARARPQVYEPDLAGSLNSLGTFLRGRNQLDEAERAYREAVELLGRHDRPDQRSLTLSNLGSLMLEQDRWEEAETSLRGAVKDAERLRGEVLSLDRRLTILRQNVRTYEAWVVCLMKLGRPMEALEAAEQGKSRTLIDLLTLRDLRPHGVAEDVAREYERILIQAQTLEDKLRRNEKGEVLGRPLMDSERIAQELMQATNRLRELTEEIRELDPDFLPAASPLARQAIIELARNAAASLVLFRVTDKGSYVFLVFPQGEPEVVEVPAFTSETLAELLVRFEDGDPTDGWVLRYYDFRDALAGGDMDEVRRARRHWLAGLDDTLGSLYTVLLKPVHKALRERGAGTVVLVPNQGLAILPLHACWWQEEGARRYFMDEFVTSYAPSLSVFKRCLERAEAGRTEDTVLAVANPDPPGDLVFSDWECGMIERAVGTVKCLTLRGREATKSGIALRMEGRHWLHFSCHAQYRLDAPLESTLLLADGDRLSMREIFETFYLPDVSLVSLSACETGLVDFQEVADEHYGLPVAFLYAGAQTVYATLWAVNDLSTALVMVKTYEGVVKAGKAKAVALRDAQMWVRDLTADALRQQLSPWPHLSSIRRDIEAQYDPNRRPFEHPYWWGAFQCVGA